jgi:hypothetical protein
LYVTLGIVGTPHGHSIANIGPPKLSKLRGSEEILPRAPLTLERTKPQNRAPLLIDLGGESKGKNHEEFMHTSPTKSQRERSQNRQEKAPKITKKEKR